MVFWKKLGKQTQVNERVSGEQDDISIAALPDGGFVAVWEGPTAESGRNAIYQRVYDAKGNPLTAEVVISTESARSQSNPMVEVLEEGAWVVVWEDWDSGRDFGRVAARMFSAEGDALGDQFQVNSRETGAEYGHAVTALDSGGFLITWYGAGADGDGTGIRAQVFSASGDKIRREFTVNQQTEADQKYPEAITLSSGQVVVSWQEPLLDGDGERIGNQSFGQILTSNGRKPVGETFEIFADQDFNGVYDLAALADGSFVAVGWNRTEGYNGAVVQIFDKSGVALGDSWVVMVPGASTYDTQVAATPEGGFVVSATVDFYGTETTAGREDTYIQRFDADGQPVGPFAMANRDDGDGAYQYDADLTVLRDGTLVVAYEDWNADGDDEGVFFLRFAAQTAGTAANEKIVGSRKADAILGAGGKDELVGKAGDDALYGGKGGDKLVGGKGADLLDGGQGRDVLVGQAGADLFVFGTGYGADVVRDFRDDVDTLAFDGLGSKRAVLKHADQVGDDVVFAFGDGDRLTIRNTTVAELKDDILI
ncbi:hypothetical protein [Pseudodonghicola flavimaris]|uniref:Calcium-binding protein n=1 Tax=Pseudodonghicola flavimaris TaxID=3050036 RepID=A0ABT7EUR6_9RHOB|nr:hypothetical protein [Pseudodonghicola flavimaris]MDK3016078.1 hypothetical protein [Pseudodonghicola flavimaris]